MAEHLEVVAAVEDSTGEADDWEVHHGPGMEEMPRMAQSDPAVEGKGSAGLEGQASQLERAYAARSWVTAHSNLTHAGHQEIQ